jgi:hypothetical protein
LTNLYLLGVFLLSKPKTARHRWLMHVILATQGAEIRRITAQSQPRQIVHETLSWKKQSQKGAVGVAQGVGPEFKSQYHTKKKSLTTTA